MKPKRRSKYADMSPLERSIFSREHAISRMKQNIARIKEAAVEEVAEAEARIREKQVLLDALKRGSLKL